jgi:Septum formation
VRGFVVAAVGIVAVGVLGTACSGDDDVTKPHNQKVLDIDVNTGQPVCMEVTEDLPAEVSKLPIIDCAQPHSHEIYATVTSKESVYPGVDALGSFAQVQCLSTFEDFVGISAFDSDLSYTWLVPSLKSWNDDKDREVLCVLTRRDGAKMTGSMKGTKT